MNERNHRMNHNAISMVQLLAATLLCLNLAEGAGNGAMLRSPTMTVRFEQTTPKFYIFAGSMTEVPSKYFLGQFSEIGEYNGDNGVTGRYFSRLVDDTWTFGPVTEVAAGLTTINITRTLSVASTPVTFRVEASMYKNETTITSGGSRMAIPQDSLRLQLHVSNWPFASTSNTLRIYMRFTDLYYDNPDIRVAKLNGNLAVLSLPGDTMSANIAFAAKSSINNTSQPVTTSTAVGELVQFSFPSFSGSLRYDTVISFGPPPSAISAASSFHAQIAIALVTAAMLLCTM